MAVRGSGLSLRKRDPGRQRRVRVPCPFQDTRNARANASGTRSKGKAARAEVSGNKGKLKAGWEPAPGTRPGCHRTVTGPSPGRAGCCHIALAEEGQTQFGGKGFSGSSILRDGVGVPHPACPDCLRDGAGAPHPACPQFLGDAARAPCPACPQLPQGWSQPSTSCLSPLPCGWVDGDGVLHPT